MRCLLSFPCPIYFVANSDDEFCAAAGEQVDDRVLAALRVMFSRSKQELEGKTAAQLGRYKVCNNENKETNINEVVAVQKRK